MTTTASLPLSSPVAALLAAEGTRRGLPHPLPEQALADALRRSQASVGQAKRRGAGVTVRKLAELCSALGWRLVLSVERDATVLADIVGPARAASVGASCRGEESRASILARARCRVKMSLAHSQAERAEQEAKRAEREALLGYAETADDDSAARGAGESEE